MKCMRCGKEMRNTIGGNYICDICGLAINDLVYRGHTATPSIIPNQPIVDNNIACPGIGDIPGYNFWGQQGWVCQKCGASLSPSTTFCPFCAPNRNKTFITDKTYYDIDYLKYQSITGTSSEQYVNPNISTTISSKEK